MTACPNCAHPASGVKDSRLRQVGDMPAIRRRRKCDSCGTTFTTFEITATAVSKIDRIADLVADVQQHNPQAWRDAVDRYNQPKRLKFTAKLRDAARQAAPMQGGRA